MSDSKDVVGRLLEVVTALGNASQSEATSRLRQMAKAALGHQHGVVTMNMPTATYPGLNDAAHTAPDPEESAKTCAESSYKYYTASPVEFWTAKQKGRALHVVLVLANTPPEDWLRRSEIWKGLAEFRTSDVSQGKCGWCGSHEKCAAQECGWQKQ
jgi:hypothetical protein